MRNARAAVLGAGSWGTAFAKVLADAGTDVTIWARREAVAANIRQYGVNPDYLSAVRLPDRVTATSAADEAIKDADVVVQEAVASGKHVMTVDYVADTTTDELRAEVKSNKPAKLHHPLLASSVTINANQTYTVTLSNVKPGQTAQLAITPTVLTTPTDCPTWGSDQSTDNGSAKVVSYGNKGVVIWLSINGRSTAFTLSAP